MLITEEIVNFLFGLALFVNALIFIPQAARIMKTKNAEGVSITTFLGFFVIQILTVLHGLTESDYILTAGYMLSMVANGFVITLAFYYRYIRVNNKQFRRACIGK